MNRKDFLKNILLGSAGAMVTAPLPATAEPSRQIIRLAVTFIAGFQHYDGPEVLSLLETGMPLQLNREPHNPHDKNAVEIWSGDAKAWIYSPFRKQSHCPPYGQWGRSGGTCARTRSFRFSE